MKALKCKCGTPIGTAAGKELEQLTLDAMTQASKHHQPSEVPAPIAVTSAFDVSAYYQGPGSAKIAPTLGQAKAAPSSSEKTKSVKKNGSAPQQLMQATKKQPVKKEEPYLDVFEARVTRAKLTCLEDNVSLTDTPIHVLLNGLAQGIEKSHCLVMNTFLYTMFENDNRSIINHTKSVAKSRPLFIVLPINQERLSHWSLAIFANVNGQLPQKGCDIDVGAGMFILYLDSAFSANETLHNNLQKFGRVIS